jgi:hypothetical protein
MPPKKKKKKPAAQKKAQQKKKRATEASSAAKDGKCDVSFVASGDGGADGAGGHSSEFDGATRAYEESEFDRLYTLAEQLFDSGSLSHANTAFRQALKLSARLHAPFALWRARCHGSLAETLFALSVENHHGGGTLSRAVF